MHGQNHIKFTSVYVFRTSFMHRLLHVSPISFSLIFFTPFPLREK